MGRILAISCAGIGVVWALTVVLSTLARVRGPYIVSAAQASRLYGEASMGLLGLAVVTLSVILLVQATRRS